MKVDIGPYVAGWSRYDFECWYLRKRYKQRHPEHTSDAAEYLEIDERDFNKCDHAVIRFLDWWQSAILDKFVNPIFFSHHRKIKVRIDRGDTWSMDDTLSWIVLPMLYQLRDTKHGSPFVDNEDVPEYLHVNDAEDVSSEFHDRWEWVLDEMIWAFEQKTQGMNCDDMLSSEQAAEEVIDRWNSVNENIKSDSKIKDRRIQHGFMLFGKYYQNLWD